MGKATYGTGTIFKRGRIWYVAYFVDGKQKVRSSKSANILEAKKLRDQILGKKARGELSRRRAERRPVGNCSMIFCNTPIPTSSLRRKEFSSGASRRIFGPSLG